MARGRYVVPWLVAALLGPAALPGARALPGPPADGGAGPRVLGSACPASRDPVPVGDPRLAAYWRAAAAFDRPRYGFPALPAAGDVIFERHPEAGTAVIHTCQRADRLYRTVHFRTGGEGVRWVGEQQAFRSGRDFEDPDAGTLQEEITFTYEIEPVAGFPLDRLNIQYRGPLAEGAGRFAILRPEEARAILGRWGF